MARPTNVGVFLLKSTVSCLFIDREVSITLLRTRVIILHCKPAKHNISVNYKITKDYRSKLKYPCFSDLPYATQ